MLESVVQQTLGTACGGTKDLSNLKGLITSLLRGQLDVSALASSCNWQTIVTNKLKGSNLAISPALVDKVTALAKEYLTLGGSNVEVARVSKAFMALLSFHRDPSVSAVNVDMAVDLLGKILLPGVPTGAGGLSGRRLHEAKQLAVGKKMMAHSRRATLSVQRHQPPRLI